MNELAKKKCRELPKGTPPLSADQAHQLIQNLPGWTAGTAVIKTFSFKNYYETMAFVNAIALISHTENHHTDLEVGYNKCAVEIQHAFGGRIVGE